MKRIVLIMPRGHERHDVLNVLQDIAEEIGQQINEEVSVIQTQKLLSEADDFQAQIISADVVVADVSRSRPDVMYRLGLTHGKGKPTVLVSEIISQPRFTDLSGFYKVLYDRSNIDKSFRKKLLAQIIDAVRHPKIESKPEKGKSKQISIRQTVFISYSHNDTESLERLRVHLKPLKRDNDIEFWDDAQIEAGARWEQEIKNALGQATIAVLMISADYLASDFVVNNELPPLLKAAEERGTTILPVVLKPCRFLQDRNLSVFQAINDPEKPLLMLPEIQQEAIYVRIAERIDNELIAIR